MNTGMLWFDNDPKTTLEVKIQKAAEYYRHKYGRTPDLCLVNPALLAKSQDPAGDFKNEPIHVRALRSILPGHLWIGVDEPATTGSD